MYKMKASVGILALATMTNLVVPALADPLERYAELQAVGEAINDPDPLMRLALLEEIIAKGDATEVQLAIRTAFTIDDPNIRSLALRAHFASFQTVVITADWPDAIKTVLDSGNEDEITALKRTYEEHMNFMAYLGGAFTFRTEYNGLTPEFIVHSMNGQTDPNEDYQGQGNIKGAVVTIQSGTKLETIFEYSHNCTFEFTEYSGFTIKGTASCDFDNILPFPVTLHLFEPDASAS